MSELQTGTDAAPETKTEAAPAESQNVTGSELATDSVEQHEEKAPVDEAAAKSAAKAVEAKKLTQDIINKKHFEAKQFERERDNARAEIAEFKKAHREAEAVKAGQIPDFPDQLDDNFPEKLAAYNEAIAGQATFKEQQANYAQTQQNQQLAAQQQADAAMQASMVSYNAKAVELGINAAELQTAGSIVGNYGFSQETIGHILAHPNGPLITKHLAGDVADGMKLTNMSDHEQGAFIETLSAKAELLKPKPSNTPDPVDNLSGNGAQPDLGKFPNSRGATFS